MVKLYKNSKQRRVARVRSKFRGTAQCPRLSVFRSNKYIFAQLIDDSTGATLASACSRSIKNKDITRMEASKIVGGEIAQKALSLGIKTCVFDRGPYKYHGRVAALAVGAREGGLRF